MTILKKRSTAIIIVAVIGVLFTLYGARRSLNREAAKVESVFYSGTGGETPISTYLDNLFKEAKTVYSIASKYLNDEATVGFRQAYNDLYSAETISAKYDSYDRLMSELDSVTDKLKSVNVADNETEYLNSHIKNMRNIKQMIDSSDYNVRVAEFERVTLGAFPANLLKLIVRPNMPEYFGNFREG